MWDYHETWNLVYRQSLSVCRICRRRTRQRRIPTEHSMIRAFIKQRFQQRMVSPMPDLWLDSTRPWSASWTREDGQGYWKNPFWTERSHRILPRMKLTTLSRHPSQPLAWVFGSSIKPTLSEDLQHSVMQVASIRELFLSDHSVDFSRGWWKFWFCCPSEESLVWLRDEPIQFCDHRWDQPSIRTNLESNSRQNQLRAPPGSKIYFFSRASNLNEIFTEYVSNLA